MIAAAARGTWVFGALLALGAFCGSGSALACGWWGDAEHDDQRDATVVGPDGKAVPFSGTQASTPESLTRQANALRRFGPSGYSGAARLYKRAADGGYAPAQNNLGVMYEEGLGVPKDDKVAARWYRLAAEQGEAHAQHSLGILLLAGRGLSEDRSTGLRWLEKAADRRHAGACADLLRLSQTGQHHAGAIDVARWRRCADVRKASATRSSANPNPKP